MSQPPIFEKKTFEKNEFMQQMHSDLFCINLAHFGGKFWELDKYKKRSKNCRKVQKCCKAVKINPKITQ